MEEEKVVSTQDSLTPSATVHELSDSVMTGKADFSKTKILLIEPTQISIIVLSLEFYLSELYMTSLCRLLCLHFFLYL